MNRLILIGNGFDLALGLDTSYQNFIIWLQKKYIKKALLNRGTYINNVGHSNGYFANQLFSVEWTNSYVFEKEELDKIRNISQLRSFVKTHKIKISNECKLFKYLISHFGQKGWVDIEMIFYTLLLECLRPNDYDIKKLNSHLNTLKKELEEYLTEINSSKVEWDRIAENLINQLNNPLPPGLIHDPSNVSVSNIPERICFVNFNYTETVKDFVKLFRPCTKSTLDVISIHGNLNDKSNPIIFGFGDEIDERYLELEKRNDNQFFKHIKSFKYLQSSQYHNLIRFIDQGKYQVYIYGHSCGLSDRTMLREIFEHTNCISIKPFYYLRQNGSDDFEDKVMEISRHFTNKAVMRRKVSYKTSCFSIPQIMPTDQEKKRPN